VGAATSCGFFIMNKEKNTECWRDVSGHEGCYQVSDFGRVRSLDRIVGVKIKKFRKGVLLKPKLRHGYLSVKIGGRCFQVHQLVAIAFLNHIPCKLKRVVDHVDGVKSNNHLDNLQIVTQRDNLAKSNRCTSRSLPIGVYKTPSGKFESRIHYNKKNYYLGTYRTPKLASEAYEEALAKIDDNKN
jgi:hypothetical protein